MALRFIAQNMRNSNKSIITVMEIIDGTIGRGINQ
jgi:hypothetical protein